MPPRTAPNFCSQCGASLSSDDEFCSRCGTTVGDGTTVSDTGTIDGDDRSHFRRRVEDHTVEGWDVKHDYGDRVVLVDREFGSVGVHVLLFLFTLGFGNALYAAYSYSVGAERKELRDDGSVRHRSGRDEHVATDADARYEDRHDAAADDSLLGNPRLLVISFLCALVGLTILDGASGVPSVFAGVAVLVGALLVLPPVRKRLAERESVTTFGRVRSTDGTVVEAPDVPCASCARPVGTGVRRTFSKRYCVAGVPVANDESGENYYCRSCARSDPFTDDAAASETEREAATSEVERDWN